MKKTSRVLAGYRNIKKQASSSGQLETFVRRLFDHIGFLCRKLKRKLYFRIKCEYEKEPITFGIKDFNDGTNFPIITGYQHKILITIEL